MLANALDSVGENGNLLATMTVQMTPIHAQKAPEALRRTKFYGTSGKDLPHTRLNLTVNAAVRPLRPLSSQA